MELLEVFTTYFLTNFLIPGSVFIMINKDSLFDSTIIDNSLIFIMMGTFVGIVLSRITSLLLEPMLKKIMCIIDEPYDDYLYAEECDEKIQIFLRVKNMYSILSLVFLVQILFLIPTLLNDCSKNDFVIMISFILLFVLFAASYKKQHNFITKRVKRYSNKENKGE